MSDTVNRQVVMASRPVGMPSAENFRLENGPMPELGADEVLCRTLYLSLDPYMRMRMVAGPSYAAAAEIGSVMEGGAVGQVLQSNVKGIEPGDFVEGRGGWQDYWTLGADAVRKLDPNAAPLSTALGVLGMPGMTAYTGLLEIGAPKDGDTLVVAAASGAVGAVVGQIAKIKGCRAVGVAGGPDKCAYVVNELGFDACIDHYAADFAEQLAAACPDGIDIYFENVGGKVFEAVVDLLNPFSRIPVCGLIAHYNDTELPAGPNMLPNFMRKALINRYLIRGFIVRDFAHRQADFLTDVSRWIDEGKLMYREHFIDGLENAPDGLIGLLQGKNFGKAVVRVSTDPNLS